MARLFGEVRIVAGVFMDKVVEANGEKDVELFI